MRERDPLIPVVYVKFRRGNEILLVRRKNADGSPGHYSLPAGHIEGAEFPDEGAKREAGEEVGLHVEVADLVFRCLLWGRGKEDDHDRCYIFMEALNWSGDAQNAEPEKHAEVVWCPEAELPEDNMSVIALRGLQCAAAGVRYENIQRELPPPVALSA